METKNYDEMMSRTKWFRDVRYGAFIHWGIYSVPARGEWVKSSEKLDDEKYQQYFDDFNPDLFDAEEWAKLIKKSGMKYAVMTAKHHDGYCLFDSKLTDYTSQKNVGRDLIREYLEAMRKHDIKVGLYYSLVDWHHPDYPAYGDRQHPMRDHPEWKEKKHNFDNYLAYMHGQIKELLTNYGTIDIIFFDFSYWNMKGEAWKATRLVRMIRELQPDIIINNRLGGDMEAEEPQLYAGDYESPEQCIPVHMLRNHKGQLLPWELNITLNNSWGYVATDHVYKDASFVIRTLVECVSKNGNLLVNIGPNGRGEIPKKTREILLEVGDWLYYNGDSIYGCGPADIKTPQWGKLTQSGKTVYVHVFLPVVGHMNMEGMKGKIKSAYVVADHAEVIVTPFWNEDNLVSKQDSPDDIYLSFGSPVNATYALPDKRATVIKLCFNS